MAELKIWEDDPSLYLFTSLTAGSSHIVTATSRMETILKANRLPFSYIDTATNEGGKQLFQRRARGKKLPLLVKEGFVIADLEQLEDWNEFGEVKEAIGPVATTTTSVTTTPAKAPMMASSSTPAVGTPSKLATSTSASNSNENAAPASPRSNTMKQLAEETASAAQTKKNTPAPLKSLANTPPKADCTTTTTKEATPTKPTAKDNPLSPTSVPLPTTPSVASPTARGTNSPLRVSSPLSSPTRPSPHGRHSSGSSTHSAQFVPDHFDAPPITHRGSSLSIASDEEIKRIESDATIHEENEEEAEAQAESEKIDREKVKKLGDEDEDLAGNETDSSLEDVEEEKEPRSLEESTKETDEAATSGSRDLDQIAEGIDKVKITDQKAGDAKHATTSVED
ncbi:hypothetical protein EJ08DRAFT_663276 [Tothia fuscella]|uniref:Glutaredoxin domain-containing protein n=1 Tax=Tothia fuscella TaxID=1048955 RepID=A0A9P4NLR6_9PEZI|nr:hypothetical protein EJ08DRAFT_663276 [Tothia fuscella]